MTNAASAITKAKHKRLWISPDAHVTSHRLATDCLPSQESMRTPLAPIHTLAHSSKGRPLTIHAASCGDLYAKRHLASLALVASPAESISGRWLQHVGESTSRAFGVLNLPSNQSDAAAKHNYYQAKRSGVGAAAMISGIVHHLRRFPLTATPRGV